jgi:hypothetical protein
METDENFPDLTESHEAGPTIPQPFFLDRQSI